MTTEEDFSSPHNVYDGAHRRTGVEICDEGLKCSVLCLYSIKRKIGKISRQKGAFRGMSIATRQGGEFTHSVCALDVGFGTDMFTTLLLDFHLPVMDFVSFWR